MFGFHGPHLDWRRDREHANVCVRKGISEVDARYGMAEDSQRLLSCLDGLEFVAGVEIESSRSDSGELMLVQEERQEETSAT